MIQDDPLPPSAQLIVDAVGYDLAITVVARFGGVSINLPHNPDRLSPLSKALGHDAAKLLCAQLGPGMLAVPRAASMIGAQRDREIVARRRAGETEVELALRMGLTERHIRRICSAHNWRNEPVMEAAK